METWKFSKAEVDNAVKIFENNISYLDTSISREDGDDYITISIKENGKSNWLGSSLLEKVVDFVRAYETLGKDLFFTVEVNENEPAAQIVFAIK